MIDKEELEEGGPLGRRIGRADRNGDGVITPEELDGMLGGGNRPGPEGGEPEGEGEDRPRRRGGAAERAKGVIERLDRNGNGVIDKDELPEGWGERLGPADTNGDGVISLEELEGLMEGAGRRPRPGGEGEGDGPPRPNPEGGRRGGSIIERLDRNGNGVIDLDELDEGMRGRLAPLDANGDGVIDESELEGMRRGRGRGGDRDGEGRRPRPEGGRGGGRGGDRGGDGGGDRPEPGVRPLPL